MLAQSGVTVAERSGRLLAELVPAIDRTADLTRGVAGTCREQASSVEQMNRAMSQVELVTQRNASAAEELAATVEEITASAESLRDLVSYFRVEEARRVWAPESEGRGQNGVPGRRVAEVPPAN